MKENDDGPARVKEEDEAVERDNRELKAAVDDLVSRDPELRGRMWRLPLEARDLFLDLRVLVDDDGLVPEKNRREFFRALEKILGMYGKASAVRRWEVSEQANELWRKAGEGERIKESLLDWPEPCVLAPDEAAYRLQELVSLRKRYSACLRLRRPGKRGVCVSELASDYRKWMREYLNDHRNMQTRFLTVTLLRDLMFVEQDQFVWEDPLLSLLSLVKACVTQVLLISFALLVGFFWHPSLFSGWWGSLVIGVGLALIYIAEARERKLLRLFETIKDDLELERPDLDQIRWRLRRLEDKGVLVGPEAYALLNVLASDVVVERDRWGKETRYCVSS